MLPLRFIRGAAVLAATAALPFVLERDAHSDWPVGRHDPQRTGTAGGVSDILDPEVAWRYYLGGALTTSGMVAIDLDSDGVVEYVMVAGGSLVGKDISDRVIWQVPPRDITAIIGVSDLDGDDDREIVVARNRGLLVVDAATGIVEWETPAGLLGLFGAARLADLDGDGLDELVLVECGTCCAVQGTWTGAVYSFASGATTPSQLWELPDSACGRGNSLTLFDADGDGRLEMLLATQDVYMLLDGATGTEITRTGDVGTAVQHATCTPIDVDDEPGEELACIHNVPFYATERSVFLLDWNGTNLVMLWRRYMGNMAGAELRTIELAVGFGPRLELVVSSRSDANQSWTTYLLDAASGNQDAALIGQLVAGSAPRPGGGKYLLTIDNGGLTAWFDDGAGLVQAWRRAGDEEPLVIVDLQAGRRAAVSRRTAVLPSTGRIVVVPHSAPGVIRALELDDAGATMTAEVVLPVGSVAASAFIVADYARSPLAVSRSDGYLTPYDESLNVQLSGDDVHLGGIRTGGYYSAGSFRQLGGPPRTADIDADGRDEIIVGDSRVAMVRLDPEHGSHIVPPTSTWTIRDTLSPAITASAVGVSTIACIERNTTEAGTFRYSVSLQNADGALIWTAALPGPPLSDLLPGDFDGDGIKDFVVQWGATGDVLLRTRTYRGSDGSLMWEDVSDPGAGRAPAGPSVSRWPGEANESVLHVGASRVWVLSGPSGVPVAQSPALNLFYFLPAVIDVDADVDPEVVLTGGFAPLHLLDSDLSPIWISGEANERPYPYGTVARCADGTSILVSQSFGFPSRIKLTQLSGALIGSQRTLWLGGGDAFASESEATTAGAWLGQLTSSTTHSNLTGEGRPTTLVGSSDGYLYGLDPCAGTLEFSKQFPAAVGEAVYGDTDDDGKDEILVTVADGYLYALQNHSIDPPAWINDLDVGSDSTADIDAQRVGVSLAAQWEAVPGATGYQVAVVDREGRYVTDPPWQPVTDTSTVLREITTVTAGFYRIAVRSVGPGGHSIDSASDGVRIVAAPDDGGEVVDSGTGCCGINEDPTSALLLALVALWLVARRRE